MTTQVTEAAAEAVAQSELLTCSVDEAVYKSGLSRARLYKAMASGELLYVQAGHHRLIERDTLVHNVHRLCQRSTARP
jgi:hypothetical protein